MDALMASNVFKLLLLQFLSDSLESWHICSMCPYGKNEQILEILLQTKNFWQFFHILNWNLLCRAAYSMAHIKIPHRTKCNFSTTVWDFYTQISWFIWERSCYNSEFKKKYFSFLQSYGYINNLTSSSFLHMFEVTTTSFHTNVNERKLVAERAEFAKHVTVSVGVCFGGQGKLHFIPDTAKVNAKLYVETLLTELVQDCRSVLPFLPSGFIFRQDGAPAHTAKLAQDCIATNCSEFIGKDEWPPNLPDLNSLDYHVWAAMLECYKSF